MHVRLRCFRMSLLTRVGGIFALLSLAVAAPYGVEAQDGAPHLNLAHVLSPGSVAAVSDELTVEITVSGRGGRVGDLPLEVRDRLPRRPLEVVLVVDRSGSMEYDDYRPTRLEAAQKAAEVFLQQIQPGDSAALVSFEEYVTLDAPLTDDRDLSLDALWHLRPDGGTAIGEGLHRAIQVLQEGASESVKAIVLLSDGASNEGRDPVVAANEAKDAGIPVFTVGIGRPGDEFDEFTLRSIAETTGGEYLYAPDASELSRVYERMGGKVINVAGVNASVEIKVTDLLDVYDYSTDGLEDRRDEKLFVYRFDQIPVGEEKTIYLTGRPTALHPGARAPVIGSIRLTYQSLGSERLRVDTAGPVEVEFDSAVLVRGRFRIDRITFDRTERDYAPSIVYLQGDEVRADIEMNRNAGSEQVISYGSISNEHWGASDRQTSSGDTFGHDLDLPEDVDVGRYIFHGAIGDGRRSIYDVDEEEFFVVFEPPRRFTEWVEATTVDGDFSLHKLQLGSTTLNPRHPRVVEATADLLTAHLGAEKTPREAAEALAKKLRGGLIRYPDDWLAEWLQVGVDHSSDLAILDAGTGDCSDFSALYVSMLRSLNIPVRDLSVRFDSGRHAFAEVYLDGEWVHADPTWWMFDNPDVFVNNARTIFWVSHATSPGVQEHDRRTTLKYAVGLVSRMLNNGGMIVVNLDDMDNDDDTFKKELWFSNIAETESKVPLPLGFVFPFFKTGEPQAKNVRMKVIEDGGLDIDIGRLSRDRDLDPGEHDTAEMEIAAPKAIRDAIPSGGEETREIVLELTYGDGEGGTITKEYPLTIMLKRGG